MVAGIGTLHLDKRLSAVFLEAWKTARSKIWVWDLNINSMCPPKKEKWFKYCWMTGPQMSTLFAPETVMETWGAPQNMGLQPLCLARYHPAVQWAHCKHHHLQHPHQHLQWRCRDVGEWWVELDQGCQWFGIPYSCILYYIAIIYIYIPVGGPWRKTIARSTRVFAQWPRAKNLSSFISIYIYIYDMISSAPCFQPFSHFYLIS